MTRFLRTGCDLINVDQIRTIEESAEDGGEICTLTLLTGETKVVRGGIDQFQRDLGEVVAAAPGYTMLDYYGDAQGGPHVVRLPVVAWRVAADIAVPIAPPTTTPPPPAALSHGPHAGRARRPTIRPHVAQRGGVAGVERQGGKSQARQRQRPSGGQNDRPVQRSDGR
jgi:hypothetical protein